MDTSPLCDFLFSILSIFSIIHFPHININFRKVLFQQLTTYLSSIPPFLLSSLPPLLRA